MKNYIKYSFFILLLLSIASCTKGEVFTGSPVGTNVEFVALTGSISSTDNAVVAGQKFPITITLPQSFDVDVNVEVTSFLVNSNKKLRRVFKIPANTTTKTEFMTAVGGEEGGNRLPFNLNLEVYLSGISKFIVDEFTVAGFEGKQYSLTSNKLNFDYGDTTIPTHNPSRFSVRLDWQGPWSAAENDLDIVFKRNGVVIPNSSFGGTNATTYPLYGLLIGSGRTQTVNFNSTATASGQLPAPADGTYTLEIYAKKLVSGTAPMNLPYRYTIRYSDETVQTISGVFNNMVASTLANLVFASKKLQIVRTGGTTAPNYVVTEI
jgi:hypothetical protein